MQKNPVDTETLQTILKEYEKRRLFHEKELEDNKKRIYSKIPRLNKIDLELARTSISAAKSILFSDNKKTDDLKKSVALLKKEKLDLLEKNHLNISDLSLKYDCDKCKDTGYIFQHGSTQMCSCLKQKLFDIEYNKANLSAFESQTFKNFDRSLFSDKVYFERYGERISPRANIEVIIKACHDFIDNFDDPNCKNLMFSGGTGLGKTYLSNCIVSELLKKGKTVLYQTAPVMLDTIISNMFKNNSSFSENILNVDLLVIDDLGTEAMNNMKFAELYKIINTRLLNQSNKPTKTIISTNLDLQGLFNTYDERLVSRFIGHYNIYKFFGDDIRFKKFSH